MPSRSAPASMTDLTTTERSPFPKPGAVRAVSSRSPAAPATIGAAQLVAPIGDVPAGKPIKPGSRDGYQHLTAATVRELDRDSQWEFKDGRQRLMAWLVHEPGEQLITCLGIGYNTGQKTPTLIRRRHDRETRFICVYDLSGDGAYIRGVKSRMVNGTVQIDLDTAAGAHFLGFSAQNLEVSGQRDTIKKLK